MVFIRYCLIWFIKYLLSFLAFTLERSRDLVPNPLPWIRFAMGFFLIVQWFKEVQTVKTIRDE